MITIKEIAKELGISTTTVSNVIHGKTKEVSEETVARVQKALKDYAYVPNIQARNLASSRSGIIGVAFIDWSEARRNYLADAFIGELVGSIEQEIRARGYTTMLAFSETVDGLVEKVLSWNVDGVIIFGIQTQIPHERLAAIDKPTVYIDSMIFDTGRGVHIQLDDQNGGYLIGKYLLERGHNRIAYLSTHLNYEERERYLGLARAMTEAGVYKGMENYIQLKENKDNLEDCMDEIVEATKEYSAFFCFSDYYAMQVIRGLQDRGMRVPDDVSVCGYDGNIYSRMCRPQITTIFQSATEKGRLAVEKVFDQIQNGGAKTDWVMIPVHLLEGESVKDLRK